MNTSPLTYSRFNGGNHIYWRAIKRSIWRESNPRPLHPNGDNLIIRRSFCPVFTAVNFRHSTFSFVWTPSSTLRAVGNTHGNLPITAACVPSDMSSVLRIYSMQDSPVSSLAHHRLDSRSRMEGGMRMNELGNNVTSFKPYTRHVVNNMNDLCCKNQRLMAHMSHEPQMDGRYL